MVGSEFIGSKSGNGTASEGVSEEAAAIISAALMHVPFDGWCDEALIAGAVDAGIEPERVNVSFPSGPIDAIVAISRWQMQKWLLLLTHWMTSLKRCI